MVFENDFGITFKESNYTLNILRDTHPKIVTSTSKSNYIEMLYLLSFDRFISFSKSNTLADQQSIDCYTFYKSITVGFCDDAQLTIINTKEKYLPLGDNKLMLIDGENEEYRVNYTQVINNIFFDDYSIYLSYSENKSNWLSPIEELTSGFISNLTYQGQTIGALAKREIRRFPQRESYTFSKIGFNINNDIPLINNLSFFYNFDAVYFKMTDYMVATQMPDYNFKIKVGMAYKIRDLKLSLSGLFYKNNLIGYNDIVFNQKTEHHFASNFGFLNLELRYFF
jgi:hypothetical protein